MRRALLLAGIVTAAAGVGGCNLADSGTNVVNGKELFVQDCGSCHGMHLTGGLGPPLTPAALADKPAASLAATIFHGRPGTPMPPWRTFVTEAEALWIAEQLAGGFPPWPPRTSP